MYRNAKPANLFSCFIWTCGGEKCTKYHNAHSLGGNRAFNCEFKRFGGKKRKILEITDFLQGARKKKNTQLEFFVNFLPIGRTFRAYINDERAKTTKDFNTSKIIARPCFAVSSSRFFPPIFSPAFPGYYFLPVYNVFTHAL